MSPRRTRSRPGALLLAAALLSPACLMVGKFESGEETPPTGPGPGASPAGPNSSPSGSSPPGSSTPGGPITAPPGTPSSSTAPIIEPPPVGISAGRMPFLRLTREQYENTIADLLGVPNAGAALPDNGKNEVGFAAGGAASEVEVNAWADAAETITTAVKSKWATLIPCAKPGDDTACATQFIQSFGRRVFRRPVLAEEHTDLLALYQKGRSQMALDHAGGIGLVLEAMLQAPSFLYRWELGPRPAGMPNGDGLVRLTVHELASRLSYFLWNSMPDATLFVAADNGKLATVDELTAQARRLLMNKTKARKAIEIFAGSWLRVSELGGISKNMTKFPMYSPELRTAMARETSEFVTGVILDDDAKLSTLLTAPFSFVNGALATHYGVAGVTGDAFRKVTTPAGQRAGVLTQAALLTRAAGPAFPSPTKRGELISDRVLCHTVPPPPPNVETTLPPPASEAASSIRQQYEQHAKMPMCAGCHALIDPLGFAFLRYDAVGRWDATPGIDTTGTLAGAGSADGPFTDALDIARRLADSADVRACMAKQLFRFAIGRRETDADKPALDEALRKFEAAGQDIRELMVALVGTPSFMYRSTQEVMP